MKEPIIHSFEDYRFHPAKKESEYLMIILHGRGDSRVGLEFLRHELKLDEFHALAKGHTIINSEFELIREWFFRVSRQRRIELSKRLDLLDPEKS
ncbi:hypothetical protein HOF92_09075 [bacterium]|jgi:hypothetical protein|nr:hypothetical protein [bacterium]